MRKQDLARLRGCLCGGCKDCLRAQGLRAWTCSECRGDGELLNRDETKSCVCPACHGDGWVLESEEDEGEDQ